MAASATDSRGAGLFEHIRAFLATGVAILKTRIDIISLEIEEQREWMERIMMMAVAAFCCLGFGLLLLTLFLVVLFWETHRLWVLGGFTALYLGTGITLVLMLRKKSRERPKLFATTTAELSKDHSRLQPEHP